MDMYSFCEEQQGLWRMRRGRRRVEEEDQDRSSTTMTASIETLPRDIVLDILSRLPITSLLQFRCVSRAWRILAQHPQLATMHFSAVTARNDPPCLIFHCDYPIQNHLSFAPHPHHHLSTKSVRKLGIPFLREMPEFEVVGSCNGLLCLSNYLYSDVLYVYNPFTKVYKELPRPTQYSHHQEVVLGFGFYPTTNEYKVVRIVYYRNTINGPNNMIGFMAAAPAAPAARRIKYSQSQVQVLTLGEWGGTATASCLIWRSIGRAAYQFDRWASTATAALVDGRLHWVTRRRSLHGVRTRIIVSFDLGDERFRVVPKPDCGGLNRWNFHLLVLAGCLSAAVYCSNGKLEVWVLKEYGLKESWSKEFNIGAYLPKELKLDAAAPARPVMVSKNALNGKFARILCLVKNGKILLEYRNRALVYYDPESKKFEDLTLQGLPKWFQTIVHMGSLNWIDTPIIDM